MAIKTDDVKHIARLARLKLNDKEIEFFAGQLGRIIEYIDQLKEVETSGVEPTSHVISIQDIYREDIVKPPLKREGVLACAPERKDGLFKVPRIIKDL